MRSGMCEDGLGNAVSETEDSREEGIEKSIRNQTKH